MNGNKAHPTVDELFELLKRTSLPTVLVEGKDDIIFYRAIEQELEEYGIDMLPAGNKYSVMEIRRRLKETSISAAIVYVVDNDLWVHAPPPPDVKDDLLICSSGYSVENDLYSDGELEKFLTPSELHVFKNELAQFLKWYALAVSRHLKGKTENSFRTHPGKLLDDPDYFKQQLILQEGEEYPAEFLADISGKYHSILRGKSLFSLLLRRLSHKNRDIKFGGKQLMAIGAARKGENYSRIKTGIVRALKSQGVPTSRQEGQSAP